MSSQALASCSKIKKYDVIVSSAPFIESDSFYLDSSIVEKLLASSIDYVGIAKVHNECRFFCNPRNSVLTSDGKYYLHVNISRYVCVVCKNVIWGNLDSFSTTSRTIDNVQVVPMDNVAYICCSESCAEVLKVNPLPYI